MTQTTTAPARDWLVWSYEHNAWWGPNHRGYVAAVAVAGRYTEAEARAICANANCYLPADKPHEIAIPADDPRVPPQGEPLAALEPFPQHDATRGSFPTASVQPAPAASADGVPERRRAAPGEDTARLDWLEKHANPAHCAVGCASMAVVRDLETGERFTAWTLREAIDAARAEGAS